VIHAATARAYLVSSPRPSSVGTRKPISDRDILSSRVIADLERNGHRRRMKNPDDFEKAAQIVEAFAEGEADDRVLDLLGRIADAIRDHAVVN